MANRNGNLRICLMNQQKTNSIKLNLKKKNNFKSSFNYIKETNEIIRLLPKKYNTKIFELKKFLNFKR